MTILLDGRPMRGDRRSMVEDFPADMIDRLRLLQPIGPKNDPDGMAGIINIILKRGRFEGINGSATLTAGEYNRYNFSGMFNYRRESLIFFPMEVIDYGIDRVGGIDYFNIFIQHILMKIDSVL
ncbi:MAG: hypothetical protein CM1200mP10_02400 [Candidatus Neomarinimicrobiota bacterium]|nr:MAG: hypothetical protein CM1200mP10_02400 [Candidatus Neomarinimicrobiota bacterium]